MPPSKRKNIFPISKKQIEMFCKKHHIAFLALFGSILTSHFTDKSDVDILVKFEKGNAPNFFDLVDMESELSSMVGRQVDLKTPNDLSPYFRDEVLAKAKIIYGK
ncbi:MAG: nucleotidyltransferase family protein [Parachlamydiales bacterium]|nr:nucleotidyltransferase family protein [Parachlamydiales bacterium]